MAIFALVITFIVVVGLHELGHALAAYLCGVRIKRVSLGLGKPLFVWHYQGCDWVLARWPLGGYVQLLNSRIERVNPPDLQYSFDKKPFIVRCFILLAGAGVNLLVTFIAFFFFFLIGYQQQLPVIESVTPNSIAARAGLKANERILTIANKPTDSWQVFTMQIIRYMGNSSVVLQTSSHKSLSMDLSQGFAKNHKTLLAALGINPSSSKQYLTNKLGESYTNAAISSFKMIGEWVIFFLTMIKQLILGLIPLSLLLGPISMLVVTISSFSQGLVIYLYFLGTLSLAVGVINLLPIPSLDGGSIGYAIIEKFRGKPISIAFEILMHRFAVIFFSVLFIQLILNDLVRFLLT